jgi:hypothetical protein
VTGRDVFKGGNDCRGQGFCAHVVVSELREGGIDMDMGALAYYIDGLRERHGALYSEMCVRVQPSEMGRLIFNI